MSNKHRHLIVVWAEKDGPHNYVVRVIRHDATTEDDLVQAMIDVMGDYPRADAIPV